MCPVSSVSANMFVCPHLRVHMSLHKRALLVRDVLAYLCDDSDVLARAMLVLVFARVRNFL